MDKSVIENLFDEYKELILHMESGEKFEVHNHDVEFNKDCILIDKGEEGHVLSYDHVVAIDWHESGWV